MEIRGGCHHYFGRSEVMSVHQAATGANNYKNPTVFYPGNCAMCVISDASMADPEVVRSPP